MLITLSIQNFAIIEDVMIDFSDGMTVLSGETGAGKSIIIDALGLLIGGRGSVDFIRQGQERLSIEGQFELGDAFSSIQKVLADYGIDIDSPHGFILKREITQSGSNIVRINGQLANVSILRKIGEFLADIHGQHEHQSLLNPDLHLTLLDQFGDEQHQKLLNEYKVSFQSYSTLKKEWLTALNTEINQQQRLQFLQFQLNEIESARLMLGEEEELNAMIKRLNNQQRFSESTQSLNHIFSESETSILNQIHLAQTILEELSQMDENYVNYKQRLTDVELELADISQNIAFIFEDDVDDYTIDEAQTRLALIEKLKRKYGLDVKGILEYYQSISDEIYQLMHHDQYLMDLELSVQNRYDDALRKAEILSENRRLLANQLILDIHKELGDLYLSSSKFVIQFNQVEFDFELKEKTSSKFKQLTKDGLDLVEFYVSMNQGEPVKPLIKVASGGELSRFMLALKVIFARYDNQKVMVFDEIDTGVSGRVAQAIAEKMYQVASTHQVLAITHLPQVAAIADTQLNIYKKVINQRTVTQVSTLSKKERIEMIAQMMSGVSLTSSSLKLAEELIAQMHKEYGETHDE